MYEYELSCVRRGEMIPLSDSVQTIEFWQKVLQINSKYFVCIPEKFRSYDMYLAAVKENPAFIVEVPEKFMTDELCIPCLKRCGYYLRFIPDCKETYNMCLAAVRSRGRALAYVAPDLFTTDIVMEALNYDGTALQFVPSGFQTFSIVEAAVAKSGKQVLIHARDDIRKKIRREVEPHLFPVQDADSTYMDDLYRQQEEDKKELRSYMADYRAKLLESPPPFATDYDIEDDLMSAEIAKEREIEERHRIERAYWAIHGH